MRKTLAGLVAALTVVALAPIGAQATHCDSGIVIFSSARVNILDVESVNLPSINVNAAACAVAPDDEIYDTRFLAVGANNILVRYIEDLGPSTPTLEATLNGMGFVDEVITLTRREPFGEGLGFAYDSESIDIPSGPSGSITATIVFDAETSDTVCFHTIDAACA